MVKQAGSIFSTQYTGTPSTALAGTPKPVAATAAPGVSVVPAAEDHVHAMTAEIIAISSLSDVTISAPASLQVLRWNGSAWVNATENLDDLGDVIITTPASTQVIRYNGSNWVNSAPLLDDSSDVVLSAPATNQVLRFNGTNWVNAPGAWTTFTPTWLGAGGNPSLGNGTSTGAYYVHGKTLHVRASITMGTTTTFGTGEWRVTIPGSFSSVTGPQQSSSAWAYDSSTTTLYSMACLCNSASTFLYTWANAQAASVQSTSPFTWATGDVWTIGATIEIA